MSNTAKAVNKNTIEILLMLTENCNLSCRYCYEHNKTKKNMSYDTAKAIIDKEFAKFKNSDKKIVIQLFGGEPMLRFNEIVKIYNYVKSLNSNNFDYFFAVTNGTLLNENMKKWLYDHREDFVCGLSLDGIKEVHDYNRSNSYDLIDFEFFKKTWPTQKIKMTISPYGLPQLAKSVIHCHDLGFGVLCNLADGIEFKDADSEILKKQLYILVDYYLIHSQQDVCSILKMPLLYVGTEQKEYFPKWCGAGDHIHAYDINGNYFPCQLFMDISGGKSNLMEIKKTYPISELPEKCQSCPIYCCCPTCIGTNLIRKCPPFYHTDVECRNIKIQFLATSFLMYQKYKRGQLKLREKEEYFLLNAILKIQESFCESV